MIPHLLFLFLLTVTLFVLFNLLLQHQHQHHLHRRRQSRFTRKDLRKLPHFRFYQKTRYCESGCVICLEGFREGQSCRKLAGCWHVFHRECVDSWLLKVATCPTCRKRVRLRDYAL